MIELDRESLLVHARGSDRLADLEIALAKDSLTLDLETIPDATVATWLETGAEGARSAWLDPADHLVAGITTSEFTIKPAPRRAVGPDLLSLVLGMRGRFVHIESVWLRVHRKDIHGNVMRPAVETPSAFGADESGRIVDMNDDERRLYDAIKTRV
jgi:alkyldihydroxyacetonephosphate synthase